MGDQQMASDNPFNYSEWLRHETSTAGSSGTGDDVELGRRNTPDQHEGTQIWGVTPNNVVFAAAYVPPTESGISGAGVYGAGSGDRGIGVAGTCDAHGVGVYGMALDEGIGVVGRQMAGRQGEMIPLPVLLAGRTAGVLGHAQDGVGVYGHGGFLHPWLDSDDTANLPALPNPYVVGGIFSAGWRTSADMPPASKPQVVSLSNRPQIQLLPSNNQTLPTDGQLGDMYFVMAKHGSDAEKATVGFRGQLWICTEISADKPVWQPVLLGDPRPAGSPVPTYVYPPKG